jgi:AraC family transcriptional regulator, exoenzyme S synthesis regulatory protein ExsA
VLFFIPNEFLCETIKTRSTRLAKGKINYESVIVINTSETLEAYFLSMSSFFGGTLEPDKSLLELKFRELVLIIADNPENAELLSNFCSLLSEPQSNSFQRVMENNYVLI